MSYFAVFLCDFATLREPSIKEAQFHAKAPRRKVPQRQIRTLSSRKLSLECAGRAKRRRRFGFDGITLLGY
ncbi:MAG: hypothetical protein ACXW3C_19335, partial [Pyrinomonadaceae bacterium]